MAEDSSVNAFSKRTNLQKLAGVSQDEGSGMEPGYYRRSSRSRESDRKQWINTRKTKKVLVCFLMNLNFILKVIGSSVTERGRLFKKAI